MREGNRKRKEERKKEERMNKEGEKYKKLDLLTSIIINNNNNYKCNSFKQEGSIPINQVGYWLGNKDMIRIFLVQNLVIINQKVTNKTLRMFLSNPLFSNSNLKEKQIDLF